MRKIFGLDLRSLALLRVALGVYLLQDLVPRVLWIIPLYADDGFLPRDGRVGLANSPWLVSLHMSSGNALMLSLMFLAAMCFAVGMVVGYRTRFCTIGSWVLFASMHARNPFVDGLAEDVIIGLLFWAMFVPLEARWSVDASLNPEHRDRPSQHASLGVLALMLQVCFVYWFTSAQQTQELFPQVPWVSARLLAILKIVGPAVLFVPFVTDASRLLLVTLFMALHLTAAVTSRSPAPAVVCVLAWMMFIPGRFWDTVDRWMAGRFSIQTLLDQACGRFRKATVHGPGWAQKRLAPKPVRRDLGVWGRAFLLVALVIVTAGYSSNVSASKLRLPDGIEALATITQLGQSWTPSPRHDPRDGWYVIEGVQEDGKRLDPLRGTSVNWAMIGPPSDEYRNARVQRYMIWLLEPDMAGYRPYYAGHVCLRWNSAHTGKAKLATVNINYMKAAPGGPSKQFLLHYSCPK